MSIPTASDMDDDTPEGFSVIPTWLLRDPQIETLDKILFLLLSSRVKGRNGIESYPSQALLAEEARSSVSSVKRSLSRLVDAGLIVVKVIKTRTGRRNVYYLEINRFDGRPEDVFRG